MPPTPPRGSPSSNLDMTPKSLGPEGEVGRGRGPPAAGALGLAFASGPGRLGPPPRAPEAQLPPDSSRGAVPPALPHPPHPPPPAASKPPKRQLAAPEACRCRWQRELSVLPAQSPPQPPRVPPPVSPAGPIVHGIQKMMEIMTQEVQTNDLKEVINNLIPDCIGKDIEKACQSVYSPHSSLLKVKMLEKPNIELGKSWSFMVKVAVLEKLLGMRQMMPDAKASLGWQLPSHPGPPEAQVTRASRGLHCQQQWQQQ
ncbi:hypothetical protein QTO34_013728, partial [Cnephaeus nilssonii]